MQTLTNGTFHFQKRERLRDLKELIINTKRPFENTVITIIKIHRLELSHFFFYMFVRSFSAGGGRRVALELVSDTM